MRVSCFTYEAPEAGKTLATIPVLEETKQQAIFMAQPGGCTRRNFVHSKKSLLSKWSF